MKFGIYQMMKDEEQNQCAIQFQNEKLMIKSFKGLIKQVNLTHKYWTIINLWKLKFIKLLKTASISI
jgi:hypothetical protein